MADGVGRFWCDGRRPDRYGEATTDLARSFTVEPMNASRPHTTPSPANRMTAAATRAAGPPTLEPARLRLEQRRTLSAPEARPHLALRLMFASIDVLYGRRLSIEKFLVLEHLAQVPYRSWERVAQRRIARTRGRSLLARRIQLRVAEARAQHDNEQWHMLVMEELIARQGRPVQRVRHRLLPRLMALPWQVATWALHLVMPAASYRLNAAFEAHAERSYMRYVAEHPEAERQIFGGPLADRWTGGVTVADVLRQIGHDERVHRLDSEQAAHEQAAGTTTDPGPAGRPEAA